jgi:uncharacterized membrane protein YjdF
MKTFLRKRDAGDLHRIVVRILLFLMVIEWAFLMFEMRFLQLFLVTTIIFVLIAPEVFRNKMDITIPAEFHFVAVIFILASLYLGEIQQFYQLIWWWDMALHGTAGLLMGIFGFLLVYILNENPRVELQMKPGFIALFAFFFSISIGTVWELFEFAMDQLFGFNMQKEMFGDASGLTDTMWDMIINAAGAAVISLLGWWYLSVKQDFFIQALIKKFIRKNPSLFSSGPK